jgi:hypothetical protein
MCSKILMRSCFEKKYFFNHLTINSMIFKVNIKWVLKFVSSYYLCLEIKWEIKATKMKIKN